MLIVGVMMTALILPRPNPEYAVSELPFEMGSPDQKPSRYAKGGDAVKEKQPWSRGEKNQHQSEQPSPASDKTPSTRDESEQATSPQSQSSQDSEQNTEKGEDADAQKAADGNGEQQRGNGEASRNTSPAMRFQPRLHDISNMFSAAFFKWLIYGVLALIAVFAIWTHRSQLAAALRNFWQQLLDLWHSLFGGRVDHRDATSDQEDSARPALRRFTDFTDPFAAGLAAVWPPEELVRYTFEALEAWAADHGYPRQPEQTPHEFTRCIASNVSSLADDVRRLADLYCQAAYASGTLSAAGTARLSHLWQRLAANTESG
jgi:hypothetical protein